MSYPNEIDAVVVKRGNGATPEVFTTICGMETVNLNQTVQSNDRFRRDCAKPGKIPTRTVRVTGRQWDFTGSGIANVDEIDGFIASLGVRQNYQLVAIKYDGTDAGEELGTFSGPGDLTSNSWSLDANEGGSEMTIAGEDDLVWTPAT